MKIALIVRLNINFLAKLNFYPPAILTFCFETLFQAPFDHLDFMRRKI